jgi:hypothetical protein
VKQEIREEGSGYMELMDIDGCTPLRTIQCNIGVQIAPDGRIWVCIDGKAFIRFKPFRPKKEE